ncbi:MAG: UPF0280 family protein [Firmicutes bacterium]|jgi:ApbE superfamily uncharacterized protein (UPF0280 family)|nr:UPF0280 family protein [Bacillota bacterium]
MKAVRNYREMIRHGGMRSFTVKIKETDLWVAFDADHDLDCCRLAEDTREYLRRCRLDLENYIGKYPEFGRTLQPYPVGENEEVPPIVQRMIMAGNAAGVGPMAAVAGAFAEGVGEFLLRRTRNVIVENGGDIFLKTERPCKVGIHAGDSPLSGRVGVEIPPGDTPAGICTSSGTVGHAFSMGKADAAVVFSPSTPLADAAATALGNAVKDKECLEEALHFVSAIKGVTGALVICEDRLAAWGKIKLC